MNQTPAAILILSSTVLAYAATTSGTTTVSRAGNELMTTTSTTGVILALGALVLGIWGVISLISASIRDRELAFDGTTRHDLLGMFDPRRMNRPYSAPMGNPVTARAPVAETSGVALTPEMKAQLSMAAHLEGRERSQIVEEALRRYLPRYENSKAA